MAFVEDSTPYDETDLSLYNLLGIKQILAFVTRDLGKGAA